METDGVLDADVEIEQNIRQRLRDGRRDDTHLGENAALTIGIDTHNHSNEGSPLLGKDRDSSSHREQALSADAATAVIWAGDADFAGLPWHKRPSIFWLIPPFLLYALAFGGIVIPKLNLIMELLCRDYYSDQAKLHPNHTYLPIIFGQVNEQCKIPEVQSKITVFALFANLMAGLLSAVTSPKLGALSDRYGRTRVLILASAGALTGEIITIIAAKNPETFPTNWLFLGYFLDGLCGSFTAAMAISNSYAADCTPPHKRNVAFGYFFGCLFTGIAVGPLITGSIVKATGSLVPILYMALGVHLVFISFLAFVIPESLSHRRQLFARERYAQEEKGNSAGWFNRLRSFNVFKPLKILYPTGEGSSPALRRNLLLLAAVDTTMFGVAMGSMTVVIIYSRNAFDWDVLDQSVFTASVNACRVFFLFGVLPLASRWFRGSSGRRASQPQQGCDKLDLAFIRTAVVFDTLGYLGYTLARTGPLFILSGCIASVGGIGSPTMQSALTKHLPHDRTGELLGASGLLHALARIVAPSLFGFIYSVTVGRFTQAVFVCLSVTFGIAAVLSLFLKTGVYLQDASAIMPRSIADDAQEDIVR